MLSLPTNTLTSHDNLMGFITNSKQPVVRTRMGHWMDQYLWGFS